MLYEGIGPLLITLPGALILQKMNTLQHNNNNNRFTALCPGLPG